MAKVIPISNIKKVKTESIEDMDSLDVMYLVAKKINLILDELAVLSANHHHLQEEVKELRKYLK